MTRAARRARHWTWRFLAPGVTVVLLAVGCGSGDPPALPDVAMGEPDAAVDSGLPDTGLPDTGLPDTGLPDTGPAEVPLPEVWGASPYEDINPDPDVVEVNLTAQFEQVSIGGGMSFELMTYNGSLPGPAIQARVGDEVIVHFENQLDQPTTIHWHGMRIPYVMDGNPRVQTPVEPGGSFTYSFSVPEAATYWYHPHVRTNEQLELGLYAPFIIRDDNDPEYDTERLLVLDDILVDPDTGELPPFLESMDERLRGRIGNHLLVNGRLAEEARASAEQGEVERWRIVNSSNARTFVLDLMGAPIKVIAVDGGKLARPYEADRLSVAIGQRYDLEVNLADPGAMTLGAIESVTDEGGVTTEQRTVMFELDVAETGLAPRTIAWPRLSDVPSTAPNREESIVFEAYDDPELGVSWRLNGLHAPLDPLFVFQDGDVVRLSLENVSGSEHPFHLHGQFFTIVDDGQPWTDQPGLKDTVLIPAGQTMEVIAFVNNVGRWMAHCHILEHAALGMMAEIIVQQSP